MSNPSIKRIIVTVELATGDVVETRVLYSDQIQLSKSIKANGWPEDYATTPEGNAFLAWKALSRDGQLAAIGLADLGYKDFLNDALVDMAVRREDADTHAGDSEEADAEDPTPATR